MALPQTASKNEPNRDTGSPSPPQPTRQARTLTARPLTAAAASPPQDLHMCRYDGKTRHNMTPDTVGDWQPVEVAHIRQAMKKGATLQVHQPHRYSAAALQLVAALEERFGCLVGVNAYITPTGSQVRQSRISASRPLDLSASRPLGLSTFRPLGLSTSPPLHPSTSPPLIRPYARFLPLPPTPTPTPPLDPGLGAAP